MIATLPNIRLSRRICGIALGLGVVSALGNWGTFAAFTATSSNPGNTFESGSLSLKDTTTVTSANVTFGANRANQTGTDPRGTLAECTASTVAASCSTLLRSINVATPGMAPGQYLQGTILISNAGTLPGTVALQVQNIVTNNGNGTAGSAAGVSPCATDISGVGSPGTTGARLTTGALTGTGGQPLTGCLDLGNALRITIQDGGANGTGPQCVFGNDTGGTLYASGTNGNSNIQAPVPGGLSTGGGGYSTYVATGAKLAQGSGACDDYSQLNVLGSSSAPVTPGANTRNRFGAQTVTPSNSTFAGLGGITSMIFIPGGSGAKSLVNAGSLGGDLRQVHQWAPNETHAFTVTVAFPDTGTTTITDSNSNNLKIGNDNPFQGGAATFDLYWFAIQ